MYVWQQNSIRPYESLWSIFSRFCALNLPSHAEFWETLANHTEHARPAHFYARGSFHSARHFNSVKAKEILGPELFDHLELSSECAIVGYDSRAEVLRYCPRCLEHAYHSTLHQLVCLAVCPIHDVQIETKCDHCNREIAYFFSPQSVERPFTCKCGKPLYSTNIRFGNPKSFDSSEIQRLNVCHSELDATNNAVEARLWNFDQPLAGRPLAWSASALMQELNPNCQTLDWLQKPPALGGHKIQSSAGRSIGRQVSEDDLVTELENVYRGCKRIIKFELSKNHATCISGIESLPPFLGRPSAPGLCDWALTYCRWIRYWEEERFPLIPGGKSTGALDLRIFNCIYLHKRHLQMFDIKQNAATKVIWIATKRALWHALLQSFIDIFDWATTRNRKNIEPLQIDLMEFQGWGYPREFLLYSESPSAKSTLFTYPSTLPESVSTILERSYTNHRAGQWLALKHFQNWFYSISRHSSG